MTRVFPIAGVLKWPHSDRQATRKTPKTNSRAFPLLLRVKIQRISTGRQPTKNWQAFPPFRGFKMGQFRSASDQKNAQKKMSIGVALIAGNNRRYLSHVRRTLVWGLNSRRNPLQTTLALSAVASEGCGTKNAKRWGCFWGCPEDYGCPEDSYSTLALEHPFGLISRPPSGAPPHTAVVAMWGGDRTRR